MLERIEALLVSLRDQVDTQADQLAELSSRFATMQAELHRRRAAMVATIAPG